MGHELLRFEGESACGGKSTARQRAAALLALAVTFCPARLHCAEQAASSRSAAAPANFRSSSQQAAVELRPEEPVPSETKKKANEDMSLDRLDPFYKPKAAERPAVPEPEAEEPLPTDEIEREKKRESEQERLEALARTPRVDPAAMFRASMVPRDIVDRPANEELAEDMARLSEEQLLLGKQWGINYGVVFSAVFDDNVNLSSTDKQSDILLTGGANVALRLGSDGGNFYLSGVYGISYGSYLGGTDDPDLGHNLGLSASYRFAKLTLGLNVSVAIGAGATVDTGERTDRDSYFASLSASYAYSEKVSFNVTVGGTSQGYENLLSSRDTRINAFIDYTWTPKLQVGVGGAYGMSKAEEGDVQTSQSALVRASYTVTEKLSASGSVGVELRDTDGGENLSPVFSIGAAYRPFERTTVSLNLNRRIYSSAVLEGQDYTATGVTFGVGQQLLSRLGLSLSVGYESSEYFGAAQGVDASRNDKYLFFRSSLDWEAARWCRLGGFYEYSDSESTGEGARPFSRNRLGLQLSLMF